MAEDFLTMQRLFEHIMISRREFLTNCARLAPIIGGAGIILSDPFWQGFLSGGDLGVALAGNSIDADGAVGPQGALLDFPSQRQCRQMFPVPPQLYHR